MKTSIAVTILAVMLVSLAVATTSAPTADDKEAVHVQYCDKYCHQAFMSARTSSSIRGSNGAAWLMFPGLKDCCWYHDMDEGYCKDGIAYCFM